MKKNISLLLAILLFVSLFSACDRNVYPISSTQIMMDTVVTISIYDGDDDALNGAIELCKKYEKLLSRTVATNDISRINVSNGQPVAVEPETTELLVTALDIAEKSNGAFDPTVLPLVELWDVTNSDKIPDAADIVEALKSVGYGNITVDGNTVTAKNGAKLDLGGIAKGFIADKVCEYLKSQGVTSAIINLGGNTVLLGNKNGNDFSVGVQKPFGKNGELCATLMLQDKTAVTSGVYQRYFESNGRIYHHIIDTANGYPSNNGLYAVTVVTDSSAVADGLSTACLVLGIEKGTELARQYGAELIFIDKDGNLTVTDGLVLDTDKKEIILKAKE